MEFKNGETVRLKSSGPVMTVKYTEERSYNSREKDVVCSWFSGDTLEIGWFAPSQLLLVVDEDPKMKRWFLTWLNGDTIKINAPSADAAINLAKQGPPVTIDEIDINE